MTDRVPAIRVLLLPKDTNAYGTIFGGVILSHIDLASAVEARKVAPHRYVTKAMREVEFHEPVFVGDIVSFYTETVRVGRTSVTVRVMVEAERWGSAASDARPTGRGERVKVTEAEVVLVAVDEPRAGPMPIRSGARPAPVMKWISTRGASPPVPFIDALFAGTAPDGGLYMPERLDPLPAGTVDCGAARARDIVDDRHRRRRAPAAGTRSPSRRSSRSSARRSTSRCRWSR